MEHLRPKYLIIIVFCWIWGSACAQDSYSRLYRTLPKAPEFLAQDILALEHLGPTLIHRGVNFGVYSSRASRMDLLLFDDPEAQRPTQQFEMVRFGEVWNLYVEGIGLGQHYGFVAWGPNWEYDPQWVPGTIHGFHADVDGDGNRFNPNKLLNDPYGKALHRDHDWSMGSLASGPARADSTWGAASKNVVVESQYLWSDHETFWREQRQYDDFPGHGPGDLIIYEIHPKGFTANPASGVEHPGTYRGAGEMAAYVADLGITAVELMPVHEKPEDGGYWGYWNLNFFAAENTYAWTTRVDEIGDEFKWMVDQFHQHGIEVILDVVYNHTGEGGLWRTRMFMDDVSLDPATDAVQPYYEPKELAAINSFRGLDNWAYYALSEDNQEYWNNTGVGNQTRPNFTPFRKLIMDSLRYWVEEYHIDGFRFDIAGILGEQDGNFNEWDDPANTVLQEIIDDPVLQRFNTRIIAEPWTAGGHYGPLIGAYPASSNRDGYGWGEWNGRFRDWWRAFVNFDGWVLNSREGDSDGGFTLSGSYDYYAWNDRKPYHAVNFVTAHDGFTLYDIFSYNEKRNGCGPLNPVCCESPASPWCELDSGESHNRSRDWGPENEDVKRQMIRNLFTALLVSHGTPMLLGGDEWMRTQYGNNNAYSSGADNPWNWFRWGEWQASDERHRMRDFVRQLIGVRKKHAQVFSPVEYGGSNFKWKNSKGLAMAVSDWGGKKLMVHYGQGAAGSEVLLLINMERVVNEFTLPAGRNWVRVVDTHRHYDSPGFLDWAGVDPRKSSNVVMENSPEVGATYYVKDSSMVVLEAKP